ncbi:MAG: hypothetical protein LBD70_00925 [Bifidobacteriaceae bacterium]|jgi:tetratricopeptide (TPR) repeat protein|nr:hypothetical protein [Bifidobacteriaceae bacterium]
MRLGRFVDLAGALLALAAAVWLGLVWWGGRTGGEAFAAGEYADSEERYALAGSFMPAERWKALFGAGTAVLAGGNPTRAEGLLEEALEGVPEAKECLVRVNLSLARERQGDDAALGGDRLGAVEFYRLALQTLRDGDCPALDDTAAEAADRLELKLEDPDAQPEDDPSDGGGQEDADDQSGQGDGQSGDGGQTDPGDGGSLDGSGDQADGSEGSDGDGGDQAEDDIGDRLERLNDQNRRGQLERQDQIVPPDSPDAWDAPVW